VKNDKLTWLGVQAYLLTWEAGAHFSSAFGNQMWIAYLFRWLREFKEKLFILIALAIIFQ